jgi:hypothetical protein
MEDTSVTDHLRVQNIQDPALRAFMESVDFENLLQCDGDGNTILHLLCNRQTKEYTIDITLRAIDILAGLQPDVKAHYLSAKPWSGQLSGMSPLHIASCGRDKEHRRHEVIRALVATGADLESRDRFDKTPFLTTGGCGYKEGAKELFSLGADIFVTRSAGRNFADEAMRCNKSLAAWWESISGLKATNTPQEPHRNDQYRREGVSDARYQRQQNWRKKTNTRSPAWEGWR